MRTKLFAACTAAAVTIAALPASAATYVQYSFGGSGSGSIVTALGGLGPQTITYADMMFSGSVVLDIESPMGWEQPGSFIAYVGNDTLNVTSLEHDGRREIMNSVSFTFKHGTLAGEWPTNLGSEALTGGSIEYDSGGHYEGVSGSGTLHYFSAALAPNATRTTFNITASAFNEQTSAVPEPATWGMMIIGFGAIGAAMRRRRSQAVRVAYA